jgi:hypothetical protein
MRLPICFVGCIVSVNNEKKGKSMIAAVNSGQVLGLVGGLLGALIGLFGAALGIVGAVVGVYFGLRGSKNKPQSQSFPDGSKRTA